MEKSFWYEKKNQILRRCELVVGTLFNGARRTREILGGKWGKYEFFFLKWAGKEVVDDFRVMRWKSPGGENGANYLTENVGKQGEPSSLTRSTI